MCIETAIVVSNVNICTRSKWALFALKILNQLWTTLKTFGLDACKEANIAATKE